MGETSFDSPDTIKFVAFHLKTNVMLAIPRSKKKKKKKKKKKNFFKSKNKHSIFSAKLQQKLKRLGNVGS